MNEDLYLIDPPFYNVADEYAAIAEYLAELDESEEFEEFDKFNEKLVENPNTPDYSILDDIALEDLPF